MPIWDATSGGRRTQLEENLGIEVEGTIITPEFDPDDGSEDVDLDPDEYEPDEELTLDYDADFDPDYDPAYDPSDDYDSGYDDAGRPGVEG